MRLLGLSSGTSRDGIDVAVVAFRAARRGGRPGLEGTLELARTVPYPAPVAAALQRLADDPRTTLADVTRLHAQIGEAFAAAARGAVDDSAPLDGVCSHGQTVWHLVEGGRTTGSLQLGDPARIAEATGLPIVADVRARDVAAGGHGAPLVPLLEVLLLRDSGTPVAALNLGGIANITVVDGTRVVAYDTGPANALLDAAVRLRGADPRGYDADGAIAATGEVEDGLLSDLLRHPYFAADPPKSTGPEQFGPALLAEMLAGRPHVETADLLATLSELTARSVATELHRWCVRRVIASGGGVRNPDLLRRLRSALPGVALETSAAIGVPPESKEAIAFALIGWHTLAGLPGNVPAATGARGPRILGTLTGRVPASTGKGAPEWLSMTT